MKLVRPLLLIFLLLLGVVSAGKVIVRDGSINMTSDLYVDSNSLYVNSTTGFVGISDSTPSYNLDIGSGDLNIYSGVLRMGNLQTLLWSSPILTIGTSLAQGSVRINAGGTTKMTINSSGNVGIGTGSPGEKLVVAGNINVTLGNDICIEDGTCLSSSGTGDGDVAGPASATDNSVARYSGTTGKVIQNSGVTIDDSNNLNLPNTSSYQFDGNDFIRYSPEYESIAIGNNTGNLIGSYYTTYLGDSAGLQNTRNRVTTIGYYAGYQNTGYPLTATGYMAGYQNTGDYLTATGYKAGYTNNGTGVSSTGYMAGNQNTGDSVTAIGYYAGYQNKGHNSSAYGYEALRSNSGNNTIVIGYQAGKDNTLNDQFILEQRNVNLVPLIQGNFSSGNLGIGLIQPKTKLHVNGSINVTTGYDICIEGGQCLSDMAAGTGDVVGPSASTDNAIVRWNGITGTYIQNSSTTISDSGIIDAVGFTEGSSNTLSNDISGNAATATTSSGLACTDCVTLGSETSGNYVETVGAGNGISIAEADSEGSTKTVSISATTCVAGEYSYWDGNSWECRTDEGSTGFIDGTGVANRAAFWTDSDTITNDGNFTWDNTNKRLGIGMTNPEAKLTVGGFGTPTFVVEASDGSNWFDVGVGGSGVVRFNSAGGYTTVGDSGNLGARMNLGSLSTAGVPLAITGVSGQTGNLLEVNSEGDKSGDILVINSSGAIGVGMTNPSERFDINVSSSGALRVSGNNYASQMRITDGGGVYWEYGTIADPDSFFTISAAGGQNNIATRGRDFELDSNSVSNIIFAEQDTGNVGMGTGTPGEKLVVAGNINVTTGNDICIEGGPCLSTAGEGNGDVVGPPASTDNAIVRWNGTAGTYIQNSSTTISDSGIIDAVGFTEGSSNTLSNDISGNAATSTTSSDLGCTNCVALTSETTGNYVSLVSAGAGINVTGASGEGATFTITANATSCGANEYSYWDGDSWECRVDENSGGSMTSFDVSGDTGTQTITDANTLTIDGGYGITTEALATDILNVTLNWTEVGTDDISESKIDFDTSCGSTSKLYVNGNNLACNADDDVPESGDFGAATDLETTGAISANAVALTTDTTGNYVETVAGGSGISVAGADSEGATKTVSLGTLSGNWDAGSYEIRAQTFESDVTTGTAPFTIASTTLVTNLNAELLDGQSGAYYLDNTDSQTLGTSGNTITLTNGGSVTAPYATTAADLSCTDCIGTTEITDSYVLNSGDVMTGNLNIGSTSDAANRALNVLTGDAYIASINAYGSSQGTGMVYVGQSSTYGGGITYDGDGTPASVGTTDHISIFRRTAGSDTEVLHWLHSSSQAEFEGNIDLNSNNLVGAGTGSFSGAITATTLDTGQGANELYDMDQNVLISSSPTFVDLTLTGGDITGSGNAALDIGEATASAFTFYDTTDTSEYANFICRDSDSTTLCQFTTGAYFSSGTVYITNEVHTRGGIDNDQGDLVLDDDVDITGDLEVSGNNILDSGSNNRIDFTTSGSVIIQLG